MCWWQIRAAFLHAVPNLQKQRRKRRPAAVRGTPLPPTSVPKPPPRGIRVLNEISHVLFFAVVGNISHKVIVAVPFSHFLLHSSLKVWKPPRILTTSPGAWQQLKSLSRLERRRRSWSIQLCSCSEPSRAELGTKGSQLHCDSARKSTPKGPPNWTIWRATPILPLYRGQDLLAPKMPPHLHGKKNLTPGHRLQQPNCLRAKLLPHALPNRRFRCQSASWRLRLRWRLLLENCCRAKVDVLGSTDVSTSGFGAPTCAIDLSKVAAWSQAVWKYIGKL